MIGLKVILKIQSFNLSKSYNNAFKEVVLALNPNSAFKNERLCFLGKSVCDAFAIGQFAA